MMSDSESFQLFRKQLALQVFLLPTFAMNSDLQLSSLTLDHVPQNINLTAPLNHPALCPVPFPRTPRLPWNKDLNIFAKKLRAEDTKLPRPNSDLQWSVTSPLLFNLTACETEVTYTDMKVTPRNTATLSILNFQNTNLLLPFSLDSLLFHFSSPFHSPCFPNAFLCLSLLI